MLLFLPLDAETAPLPGGMLQVSGTLMAAPGPNAPLPHPVAPTALSKALTAFRGGTPALLEMFRPVEVGAVDDLTVASDGSVHMIATVTDTETIRKIVHGVLKMAAIAVRVLTRDPDDRRVVSNVEIISVSLIDGPDDNFPLAKVAIDAPASYAAALATLDVMAGRLLDAGARLSRYERPTRR